MGAAVARERVGDDYRTRRLFGVIQEVRADIPRLRFRVAVEGLGFETALSGGHMRVEQGGAPLAPVQVPVQAGDLALLPALSDDDDSSSDSDAPDDAQEGDGAAAAAATDDASSRSAWEPSDVLIDQRRAAGIVNIRARLLPQGVARATPYDYWQHFLPLEFMRDVVIPNTNICGVASRGDAWEPLTLEELQVWVALWALMTLSPRGPRDLYWRTPDEDFIPVAPAFGRFMSHRRFEAVLDNIQASAVFPITDAHLRDDPLFSVRAMFTAFNEHMHRVYQPSESLCIDESMEAWRGHVDRMPGRRKIPRKPKSVGMEIRDVADCQTHVLVRLEPCESHERELRKPLSSRFGPTVASMVRLTEPWHGTGRIVHGDSLFGSPRACAVLADHGLFSVLMIKKRRYWPADVPATLTGDMPDEFDAAKAFASRYRGHQMYIAAFRDRRPRVIVANALTMTRTTGVQRIVKDARGASFETTLHPSEVFAKYSSSKSAVDAANSARESMASFSDTLVTREWRLKILGFLFGCIESNAYMSHRSLSEHENMSHYDFRYQVARSVLLQYRPPQIDESRRMATRGAQAHVLRSFSTTRPARHRADGSRIYLQRECMLCNARSSSHCSCNSTRALCVRCFPRHHADVLAQ